MAVCKATFGTRLIGLDMARLRVLAVTAVAVIAIPEAQAVDTSSNAAETEEVTVTGEATGSLTSVSPEESARKKTQVPGAFAVKAADDSYKSNDQVENRFYLTLDRTNRNLPGGLTKSQMEDDPSQANPLAIVQDWNKEWS